MPQTKEEKCHGRWPKAARAAARGWRVLFPRPVPGLGSRVPARGRRQRGRGSAGRVGVRTRLPHPRPLGPCDLPLGPPRLSLPPSPGDAPPRSGSPGCPPALPAPGGGPCAERGAGPDPTPGAATSRRREEPGAEGCAGAETGAQVPGPGGSPGPGQARGGAPPGGRVRAPRAGSAGAGDSDARPRSLRSARLALQPRAPRPAPPSPPCTASRAQRSLRRRLPRGCYVSSVLGFLVTPNVLCFGSKLCPDTEEALQRARGAGEVLTTGTLALRHWSGDKADACLSSRFPSGMSTSSREHSSGLAGQAQERRTESVETVRAENLHDV
ncbi:translation initiation factor IF-2-like [Choloepus didactylus]|uniref:translation initiation factor IF-2-like n=1 Tax=Choloepus didactylus TaxID=27675 RepID=UPI00189E2A8A|nr:translation initiation factor IF-2-like [Choloepus didactylus]